MGEPSACAYSLTVSKVNPEKQGLKRADPLRRLEYQAAVSKVNPEKQGLKHRRGDQPSCASSSCLKGESRKTRIETGTVSTAPIVNTVSQR